MIRPIQSELLSLKLANIRRRESPTISEQVEKCPRLVEMLWFIEWKSKQPGGLDQFAEDLVAESVGRIGTKTLLRAGQRMSYKEKRQIWAELPRQIAEEICYAAITLHTGYCDDVERAKDLLRAVANEETESPQVRRIRLEAELQLALKDWDAERLAERCRAAAMLNLPDYFRELCEDLLKDFSGGGVEYFDSLFSALFEFMDAHAKRAQSRLARTAVTEKVFEALDYAQSECGMVMIQGDSRFGKTESIKAWCDARPGRARLVNVPSSNTLADLLRRVAEALGIPYTFKTTQTELKIKVEFTLQNAGLFLVMDEGAFLLPQTYCRNTAPVRLNWARTEIVDRGLPLAIVVTPQSFQADVKRFVRSTGYVMEQFLGRTLQTITLPTELDEKDLIAVARVHFPEMGGNQLGYIAAQAMLSESYLKAVETISKRARYLAKRTGRKVTLKEIDQAISEIIPGEAKPRAGAVNDVPQVAPAASTIQDPLMGHSRAVKPAAIDTFSPRSLRGAGRVMEASELVSADS